LARKETIGWYRNPSRASQDSLGVTYEDGSAPKIVRPDFIFFSRLQDGGIAVDIVDPHGTQFSDALPKLKGLAKYAETNQSIYRRIDVITLIDGAYRVLDLTEANVRNAVATASSVKQLYQSDFATNYLTR
jgi:hypothetical protein